MLTLKSFWNKPPSHLATFEQERPQKPRHKTVSTLHWPKNDILPFLKFLQKKVFWLDNKVLAHFYTTFGVVICKNKVGRPLHLFIKCRKFLFLSLETFFCRNLKNITMSFFGRSNVETVPCPGFQGSPAQTSQGLRVVFSKNFSKATFFIFCVTSLVLLPCQLMKCQLFVIKSQ